MDFETQEDFNFWIWKSIHDLAEGRDANNSFVSETAPPDDRGISPVISGSTERTYVVYIRDRVEFDTVTNRGCMDRCNTRFEANSGVPVAVYTALAEDLQSMHKSYAESNKVDSWQL